MMRAFLYRFILLVFIFVMTTPCLSTAGYVPTDEIKEVARHEIDSLKDTPIEGLHDLGFDSRADIEHIELGEGFEIFTIDPDKLLDETSPQDLQSLVTTTNVWYFPLVVEGRAKTLLKLRFTDGKWFASGMGSPKFLKEMCAFQAAWPASSGYKYRLIHVKQAMAHIIELSQNGMFVGIIPLSTFYRIDSKAKIRADANARAAETFDPYDLRRDSKEILLDLRPAVRSNIEHYKNR